MEQEPKLNTSLSTSQTVTKITEALVTAQASIKHAKKDAQNSHLKNSYATLESVIDATKDVLLKHDILVIQSPTAKYLITRLQHKSGEYIENVLELLVSKNDMQGLGSAITYARRYALTSLLNISQADDDGNLSTKVKKTAVVTKSPESKEKSVF